jgi:hypothetical protein
MARLLIGSVAALCLFVGSWTDVHAQRAGGRAADPKSCSEAFGRCNSSCGGGGGRGQVDTCQRFCAETRTTCLSTGNWQGTRNVWQGLARN